jgi:poly(hydroxyalkanoate) granule-associated protein
MAAIQEHFKVKKSIDNPLPEAFKDSAQQIWLAGLGAFTQAQAQGSKVFDALVKEGLNLQSKTQAVAEEKLSEVAQKMTGVANDLGARATGQWDKLETIFEDRVAKALHRLGVPTTAQLEVLSRQIEALTKTVEKLSAKPGTKKVATPVRKPAPRKSPLR